MNKLEINIGLFGCISVGKSTFINAITGQQYSDVEINKTTMVPQVYLEHDDQTFSAHNIRKNNREINKSISRTIDLNQFTLDQCQPLYHHINKISSLFDSEIIDASVKINICDMPGLNDPSSKTIYFEWIKHNIMLFDVVIFMTDITKGLNNLDEMEIINLLMNLIKVYKIKMICLMNKCDDIYFDADQNDLIFDDSEQENIFIRANNILVNVAKSYGFGDNSNQYTPFFPISSENCFIYRKLIKNPSHELDQIHQIRLCKNECGITRWKKMTSDEKETIFRKIISDLKLSYGNRLLDTGYSAVVAIIQNTILSNKQEFISNHIENDLKDLKTFLIENISDYVVLIKKCHKKIKQIKNDDLYSLFWGYIKETIANHVTTINSVDIMILKDEIFIDFKDFEILHSTIETNHINFVTFAKTIKNVPEYPDEFMISKEKEFINKLLQIYEQLYQIETVDQMHTCPTNLLHYLQIIKTHFPDKFNIYSLKFLQIFCNLKCKHVLSYQNDLIDLIIYIGDNINGNNRIYYSLISTILVNRQQNIQTTHFELYFTYLVQMKKLIKNIIKNMPADVYTAFDILYEVINKNISLYLGTNGVSNLYKHNIDYSKVNCLLNKLLDKNILQINMDFEKKLLNYLSIKINNQL